MIYLFYSLLLISFASAHGIFSYDRAASLMQEGKWDQAKIRLQQLLVDTPDSPDILYDAGVASYHTKDYSQAQAYFNRVTELPQTTIALKEQAHFNTGNCAAALKNYDQAIKHYQAVLDINQANEKARHNLEQVKKMKQQEQEQKQQNDKNNDSDKKDDNKENKEKQDDTQSSSSKQDQGADKNQKDTKENSQDDRKNMNNNTEQNKEQERDKKDQEDSRSQEKNGNDSGKEQERKSGKEKREQEKKQHEAQPDNANKKQSQDHHNGLPNKNQDNAADAGQQGQGVENEKLDPQLARILQMQEKRDAQVNKQMINAVIGEAMGGAQGENCW